MPKRWEKLVARKHIDEIGTRVLKSFLSLSAAYEQAPKTYVREHLLTMQGKRRRIVTYRADTQGGRLRNLHDNIRVMVSKHYTSSPASYAYKKNKNILDCVSRHLQSTCFLKTDIHAFFDSLRLDVVASALFRSSVMRKHQDLIKSLLSACFYQERLPIGFVSSPVLSDLALVHVDRKMSRIKGVVYTRYADDFILSVPDSSQQNLLQIAHNELTTLLSDLGLSLNHKKTYFRNLRIPGDAIHVLGVNLVRQDNGPNRITVSDSYIRQVSILAGKLHQESNALSPQEANDLFERLVGQISFIRQISQSSLHKLSRMLEVKLGFSETITPASLRSFLSIQPLLSEPSSVE